MKDLHGRTVTGPRDSKGRLCDPVSGLPYGTIIQNERGEFGMVAPEGIVKLTKAQVDEITKGLPGERPQETTN